ncbi:hypothetical protein L1077_23950 [Pseudoalteromonas luteoviolacea]|uniref:hypothetical protein n=1 Tax=Pseudoalteromonas luteoviolacea TaxID=43657 RepID=UPI001F2A3773|nr:hypothetical protein [Pseudoalteromonas luteoviolacea]MCF6442487.1 hypothetical protein [Pseudoalteromonas luteoviolacea]
MNSQFVRDFCDNTTIKHTMSQPRIALSFITEAGGTAYLPKQMCFDLIRKKKTFFGRTSPYLYQRNFCYVLGKK